MHYWRRRRKIAGAQLIAHQRKDVWHQKILIDLSKSYFVSQFFFGLLFVTFTMFLAPHGPRGMSFPMTLLMVVNALLLLTLALSTTEWPTSSTDAMCSL